MWGRVLRGTYCGGVWGGEWGLGGGGACGEVAGMRGAGILMYLYLSALLKCSRHSHM